MRSDLLLSVLIVAAAPAMAAVPPASLLTACGALVLTSDADRPAPHPLELPVKYPPRTWRDTPAFEVASELRFTPGESSPLIRGKGIRRSGFSRNGISRAGISDIGCGRHGFSRVGLRAEYSRAGLTRDGITRHGVTRAGYTGEFAVERWRRVSAVSEAAKRE